MDRGYLPISLRGKPQCRIALKCVCVMNGFLGFIDKDSLYILSLLDLSAALDWKDHHILPRRLESTNGLSDTLLAWFGSYLSGRTQVIVANEPGQNYNDNDLAYGASQGLVFGERLYRSIYIYILNTRPLSK